MQRPKAKQQTDVSRLLADAIRLHQRNSLNQAGRLYEQILSKQPGHFDASHLLGVLRLQQGRTAEALGPIRTALKTNPKDAPAWSNLGTVLSKLGRFEEALESCAKALAIKPDYARALNNRGNVQRELGRLEEALESYSQALAVNPDYADAACNRGIVLRDLGRPGEALESYAKALAIEPGHAEAACNRGMALQDLKRPLEALESYARALAIRPAYAEACFNRGNALMDLGRFWDALESYDKALTIRPDYAEALNNRGNALMELGRPREALESYAKALAIKPDYAEALDNTGCAQRELGRPEEALASCATALAIRPDFAGALNNRGNALADLGRFEEALESFDKALAIAPGSADAAFNRGCLALLLGDFASGWTGYEKRWDRRGAARRKLTAPFPAWKGENLSGKRIIVYEEQGLGDIIQFSRYLTKLSGLGAQVTFLVRRSLHRLLQPFRPAIRLVAAPPANETFDYQCALLSLPAAFGTSLENIPADTGYLRPEPALVAQWREGIGEHGLKIGICWQGSPSARIDIGRSIPLRCFEPLSAIPRVRLISLQKEHGLDQLAELGGRLRIETLGPDFDAGGDAFIDTAAAMPCLDLIVTSDTSIAHLAGALGRPVWVVLKSVPDWRWLLGRPASPWYPSMTLYRQSARGDWQGVFERVASDAAKLCGA